MQHTYRTIEIGYISGIKKFKIPTGETKKTKIHWNDWDLEILERCIRLGFSTKEIQEELTEYRSLRAIAQKKCKLQRANYDKKTNKNTRI